MKVEIPGTHLGWRNSVVRRALFQVHLWLGVALGIYLCVMSLSGAALLFRIELQRAEFPHLLEPSSPDPVQILFSPQRPTPAFTTDLTTVFVDQYSGKILPPPAHQRSIGDRILQWVGPLHVGNFGGWPIRTLWLIVGLAPTVLFITGFLTWWRRVARPAYVQSSAAGART